MNLSRLRNLVNKDLKRFMRDKATIILLFLQPIIVMSLTGIVFQEGVKNVPIAIAIENSTSQMEEVAKAITSNSHFYVKEYVGSEEEAKRLIDTGYVQGAIVLKGNEIKVLMDGSKPMYFFALTKLVYDATNDIIQESLNESFGKVTKMKNNIPEVAGIVEAKTASLKSAKNLKLLGYNKIYGEDLLSAPVVNLQEGNLFEAIQKINSYQELQERTIPQGVGNNLKVAENLYQASQLLKLKGTIYGDPQLSYLGDQLAKASQKMRSAASKFLWPLVEMPSIGGPILPSYEMSLNALSFDNLPINSQEILQKSMRLMDVKGLLDEMPTTKPLFISFEVLYNGDKLRFLDLLAPIIISVSVAFSALLLTAPSIVEERQKGTLERLMTTPVQKIEIVAGKILSSFIFVFAQGLFMLFIGILFFRLHLTGSIWLLALFMAIIITVHLGVGAMVSAASKTDREALQAVLIIMLLSIILSGMIVPIEMLPSYIRPISYFLPLTYAHNMILGVMVKGAPLSSFTRDLLVLTLFAFIALIGGTVAMLKGGDV